MDESHSQCNNQPLETNSYIVINVTLHLEEGDGGSLLGNDSRNLVRAVILITVCKVNKSIDISQNVKLSLINVEKTEYMDMKKGIPLEDRCQIVEGWDLYIFLSIYGAKNRTRWRKVVVAVLDSRDQCSQS